MRHLPALLAAGFALLLAAASHAHAQPSAGPYGPIQQTYQPPADAGRLHYAAPGGDPDAPGQTPDAPTTLEAAVARAVTGDAIILRGGTYRTGELQTNQGITLQPYRDERPILKGTRVAADWEPVRGGLWRTRWETLFPAKPQDWWRREREATRTPLYKFNNDMVFVDDELLHPVAWAGEVDASSYWIDYDKGYVYIGANPQDRLVEITAFDGALTRRITEVHGKQPDDRGLTVRGLTFTQYAFRAIEIEARDPEGPAPESAYGKAVVGSTFEHCTFSYCSRVAGYFRGDHLTIRHCLVRETGTEGIFILASNDVLLEKNVVTRNNNEGITGYFASAVKIFNQCRRVTCRDNLIIDNPGSSGVWYDVGEVDGVFVNNWVERTDNGFFFEISDGALVAGNVFVDCYTGVRVLNSRGVRVVHNTLVNSRVRIGRTERRAEGDHFGWHPATGPGVAQRDGHAVVGNLLVADEGFVEPLLQVDQSPRLRELGLLNDEQLAAPQLAALDHNVYVRRTPARPVELVRWSTGAQGDAVAERFDGPGAVQERFAGFAAHSRAYPAHYGPLFEGWRLRRFGLDPRFPGAQAEVPTPEGVRQALGWPVGPSAPGAYPLDAGR